MFIPPVKPTLALLALILASLVLGACQDSSVGSSSEMKITVFVDGQSYVYTYSKSVSIGRFLQEVGITLGPDDDVSPLVQTQLRDNMQITITRITFSEECEYPELPYQTERIPMQGLAPGTEQVIQVGKNGKLQVCYRITYHNGVQYSRNEISRFVYEEPRNEQIAVGRERPNTFIAIDGMLVYISGGQAWMIEGSAANQRPLTAEGFLDGRVFDLSPDGKSLLFTRLSEDETDATLSNDLWAIMDTRARVPESVSLGLIDVRSAQWRPEQRTPTVSYSTFTPKPSARGYDAQNDLYMMELDPVTGEITTGPDPIIPPNSWGKYPFWGRRLAWSPDGVHLAWANADSVGVIDFEANDDDVFVPLLTYAEFRPLLEQFQGASVWVPTLSWSPEGQLITTVHGAPFGAEQPEDSIVFDLAIADPTTGMTIAPFKPLVGIWSIPTYSPPLTAPDGSVSYLIAYFQAREPQRSPGTEYDLWIADQDGSNGRRLFPDAALPGLRPDPENGIAWSPTGRQIALISQGNLWIVDVTTGQATQVTDDGQASRPRWAS